MQIVHMTLKCLAFLIQKSIAIETNIILKSGQVKNVHFHYNIDK